MKNIVYLWIVIFFIACEEDKGMFTERYIFQDISYSLEDGDGVSETRVFPPLSEISNRTDDVVYTTIDLLGGVENESRFSSDDERAFSLLEEQVVRVKVPLAIYDNNEIELSPYASWKYGEEADTSPSSVDGKYEVEIPPFQKVKVWKTVVKEIITVTYTIILKTEVSGKEYRVKGKWRGSMVKGVEQEIEYSDIH